MPGRPGSVSSRHGTVTISGTSTLTAPPYDHPSKGSAPAACMADNGNDTSMEAEDIELRPIYHYLETGSAATCSSAAPR